MGFRNNWREIVVPCKLENGKLYVDEYGKEVTYDINLPYNTEYQCNNIHSDNVAFILWVDDNTLIVGKHDHRVTVYENNVLIKDIGWKPPSHLGYIPCGYYKDRSNQYPVYACSVDYRRLCVPGKHKVFISKRDVMPIVSMPASVRDTDGLHCVDSEGVELHNAGVWFIQNVYGRSDSGDYL